MSNSRAAIIGYFDEGKRQSEIVQLFSIRSGTVSKSKKRYELQGGLKDCPRSRRPRTIRTSRNRHVVQERVKQNPRVSMRKIVRETGISDRLIRRIIHNDIRWYPYKFQKTQLLI